VGSSGTRPHKSVSHILYVIDVTAWLATRSGPATVGGLACQKRRGMSNAEVKTPCTVCAGMWGHGPASLGPDDAGKDETG
jgi:hypothetical protein